MIIRARSGVESRPIDADARVSQADTGASLDGGRAGSLAPETTRFTGSMI